MDVVYKCLINSGFSRVSPKGSGPLVVLGVPGCGKSSVIRQLLCSDSRFIALTFGAPDFVRADGRFVRKACNPGVNHEGKFLLLDEFQCGDWKSYSPDVIFGDISQVDTLIDIPEVNFCKFESHRIGLSTASFLRTLGFEINSSKPDKLEFGGIFEKEPEGVVIAQNRAVCDFISGQGLEHVKVEDYRGATYKVVTLILEEPFISPDLRAGFYLSATRHSEKLVILTPDASRPTC
ncbi:MAG: TGB1 protein [Xinjiang sediment betaflexivirus 1]|nr:MAG: TGB1 protein [Xinjiang sediment betaflexivirus 1]